MNRVMFIADDLGLDGDANAAIFQAHRVGALHGASLMLGQPATSEAVERARATTSLLIGWHLHLCDSQPMTAGQWPWGKSPAQAGWAIATSRQARTLVRSEIETQWNVFQQTGLPCAFINTHHHLHVHPFVRNQLERLLPSEFNGWLRGGNFQMLDGSGLNAANTALRVAGKCFPVRRPARAQWRIADSVWGIDRLFKMQADEVKSAIRKLPSGLHEFIFHPRRLQQDADLEALLALRDVPLPE